MQNAELSSAIDPGTGHQQCRTTRHGRARDIRAAISARISTTICHSNSGADSARARSLAFLQILNSLLEVADALLRVPFNLF